MNTCEQIAQNKAADIIGEFGRYHGEGNQGHNYSVTYNGRTFYSDCTAELAEKVKTDILERAA